MEACICEEINVDGLAAEDNISIIEGVENDLKFCSSFENHK